MFGFDLRQAQVFTLSEPLDGVAWQANQAVIPLMDDGAVHRLRIVLGQG